MDSDSDGGDENICPICRRSFETLAGIRQHWTKGHTDSEIQAMINIPSLPPVTPNISNTRANSPRVQSVSLQQALPTLTSTSTRPLNSTILDRATCSECGFLAKNDRGLKIHSRIHGTHQPPALPLESRQQIDLSSMDEISMIQKFGELLYKCKCSIPLVRIIQKSVRTVVCQELSKVVEYAANKNDIFSWFRLLSFPHIVLNTISRNSFKDNRRPNIIRHNLTVFAKLNDIPSLFNELLNLLAIDLPKKPRSHSEKLLIKIAQRKIGEGDIGGAVRVLCSQEGMADYTPENIEKLQSKHPIDNTTIEEEVISNLEPFEISSDQVINAIKHFPISSSGGIDGLRPRHLKDLISFSCGESSIKLTNSVAKLVNVIREGKICPKLLPIFYGAALIALAKKNGDIRPIAIGLTWRRLGGKIACFSIKDTLSERLSPIQNGFGIKGGAEAIVHAVRAFAEFDHPTPIAILKFDYKNAFNEMSRKFLLNETKNEAPSLFPMMQQAYRCPSNLHYGEIIIKSAKGTQQGDPCAPVAFCIGCTSPTFLHSSKLFDIDEFYRKTLEAVTNNKITGVAWTQASLPLSAGGLGIRKLTDLAHPAYFSSVHQSHALADEILSNVEISIFNFRLTTMLDNYPTELTPAQPDTKRLQKSWDLEQVKLIHNDLLLASGPTDRARILASSSKISSKWLQAVPSTQLGLLLDNNAARIAVALRLGSNVCEAHQCICGGMVNCNGHHGLSCKKTKGKYSRHAEINKIVSMAFTAAGFPNSLEPHGLSRRDGKRPDGLTSYPWSNGKSLVWDVTVVDTVAASYVNQTAEKIGAAADQAERDKHNNYLDLKDRYVFTPLAFESFGSIGPETDLFVRKLGKLMKRNTGESRSLDFLLQRISIAIQRGNAICIRDTFCDNSQFNVFL